eukprot:GILI01016856.1.p1 GENE.GILI01016856.1~~GILI01016856.1.p1  ORF type:complete len:230 (+),score=60.60 GILI01016856.1:93-782(+)
MKLFICFVLLVLSIGVKADEASASRKSSHQNLQRADLQRDASLLSADVQFLGSQLNEFKAFDKSVQEKFQQLKQVSQRLDEYFHSSSSASSAGSPRFMQTSSASSASSASPYVNPNIEAPYIATTPAPPPDNSTMVSFVPSSDNSPSPSSLPSPPSASNTETASAPDYSSPSSPAPAVSAPASPSVFEAVGPSSASSPSPAPVPSSPSASSPSGPAQHAYPDEEIDLNI